MKDQIYALIEKYSSENENILKIRPDLKGNGDFSTDGIKLFSNKQFIEDLETITRPQPAPIVIEGKDKPKVDGKYDVWDWIVTKSGKIVQITHDDMMDLPYEHIARHARIEELPKEVAIRKVKEIADRIAGVTQARKILDKYDCLTLPNSETTCYSQYTVLKAIQDAIAASTSNALLLEKAIKALKNSETTIKWLIENCNPENDLYQDFFNIPMNQLTEIDDLLNQYNESLKQTK